MEIYRLVINEPNEGVYRFGAAKTQKLKKLILRMSREHGSYTHPSPSEDGLKLTGKHYCGVVGLDGLKEWFGDFLPLLASSKEVYVMKLKTKRPLPLGVESRNQVVFKWKDVEVLEQKRLKYLV